MATRLLLHFVFCFLTVAAQAAEIERPIHIQLSLKDIGLTEEYFDKLFDVIIPINHTDVPEPVIIRGSRYI